MTGFWMDGRLVNGAGKPVDENGQVIAEKIGETPDAQALREARADLEGARQEVNTARSELLQAEQTKQALDDQVTRLTAQAQSQDAALADRVAELDQARARISELEAQLAGHSDGENAKPGDVDQRTKAQLKEALDGKGVAYAPSTNRDGLLALAAEHQV